MKDPLFISPAKLARLEARCRTQPAFAALVREHVTRLLAGPFGTTGYSEAVEFANVLIAMTPAGEPSPAGYEAFFPTAAEHSAR
jgi:hypothetical protein